MTTASPRPSPERILESLGSFQVTAALKTAIELELFTAIGEGVNQAAALANRCRAAERGVRILCDFLVVQGFLLKADNSYSLGPDSAMFLDRRSPAYIGSVANFMASPLMMDAARVLPEAVRKGGTALSSKGAFEPEHPIWVEFARSMAPLQGMVAEVLAGALRPEEGANGKVLDIAAGHGLFGVALARRNPKAEIYAVDWPAVLAVARENAEKAGVASRHHSICGDAFTTDFGAGYDLILITNFLHHCDPPAIESFMRKVHSALKPGGYACTVEFVPNPDRVSPSFPGIFSLVMLELTAAGQAYTFAEFDRMFSAAGFASSELRPLAPSASSAILSKK